MSHTHPYPGYVEFLNNKTICTNIPNVGDFTISHCDGCVGQGDASNYQFWSTDGTSHLMHCTIVEGLVKHGQHRDDVNGYDYVIEDHQPETDQNPEQ